VIDWLLDHPILTIGTVFLALSAGYLCYEAQHPCLKYSRKPVILYYQRVGITDVPVYGRECLERK
jgi:hypothetical protein